VVAACTSGTPRPGKQDEEKLILHLGPFGKGPQTYVKGVRPMALSDPLSITINGTAHSLPRTSAAPNKGTYTSNDGTVQETASHQYGKRNRHLFRVDTSKVAADPFQSSVNARYAMSAYLVIDAPTVGYTVAEQKAVVDGLIAQLSASSGALITKIIGGEN